jgi:hypothetical protein
MDGMQGTDYFECDRCHADCWVDSESLEPRTPPLTVHHCPGSRGIPVLGKVTRFRERRGGRWVDVERWIDAA